MEEVIVAIVCLLAGGALGYGLRGEIGKEIAVVVADYKTEVTDLRADIARVIASAKAKI